MIEVFSSIRNPKQPTYSFYKIFTRIKFSFLIKMPRQFLFSIQDPNKASIKSKMDHEIY